MNLAALVTPKITGALCAALFVSVALNVVQTFAGRAADAACTAAAATREAAVATATAEAERDRAEKVGAIATAASADEAKRLAVLDAATKRIAGAASAYGAATAAAPLDPNCRASPDRVQAVNRARGHTP
jgi:hypothetical protein